MAETPDDESEPSESSEPSEGTGPRRLSLGISVSGEGATDEDPRLLRLWLREDPEFMEKPGVDVRLVDRDPDADEAMGLAQELLIYLASHAEEVVFLELLLSIYNHLRNRGDETIKVRVKVTRDLHLTLEARRKYSRRKLRRMAKRAARAIRQSRDPE
jgi:hypothetical protein